MGQLGQVRGGGGGMVQCRSDAKLPDINVAVYLQFGCLADNSALFILTKICSIWYVDS